MNEPKIHSHITGVLPESHKLANKNVRCTTCKSSLHSGNNKCMQTWIETGQGNYCIFCFAANDFDVIGSEYGMEE